MSTESAPASAAPAVASALSREVCAVKQPKVYEQPGVILSTLHLSKTRGHTFGRNAEWCDNVLPRHASISRQHAAVVHSKQGPMIIDLFSSHGCTLQGVKLIAGRPYAIMEGDVVRFGTAPGHYKFKGTGREKRGVTEKPEPVGPATASDAPTVDESGESSASAGDKRRRESESSSSRKDAKTDSGRVPSSSSGLADPKTGRIRCFHLLVKHADSRRPSSWRQEVITISKEEARTKLAGLRAQLTPLENDRDALEAKFQSLAKVHSDCSSAKHGGDLGFFVFPKMQPAFSKASFDLRVGQLSDFVFTDSGVHIILRKE